MLFNKLCGIIMFAESAQFVLIIMFQPQQQNNLQEQQQRAQRLAADAQILNSQIKVPTGEISHQNQFRLVKMDKIDDRSQIKPAVQLLVTRSQQIEAMSKALEEQSRKLEETLGQVKQLFLSQIDKYKSASLGMSHLQNLIEEASKSLQSFSHVTSEYFLIFANSVANQRLPKVMVPSVFAMNLVDRLLNDVNDLLEKITEAEVATEADEDCSAVQALEAMWEYMLAVAGELFQFREKYAIVRQQRILSKGKNPADLAQQFQKRKKEAIHDRFYAIEVLSQAEHVLSKLQFNEKVL